MPRKVVGPTGSRRRRWWFLVGLVVVVGTAAFFIAGAGAVTGSPSNFESNDGNMTVENAPATDWNCFAGSDNFAGTTNNNPGATVNTGTGSCAKTTGAQQVTADPNGNEITWVNGQKFDTQCPALQTGNVPNKDDFTHIASYTEIASNFDVYFYGATIRETANGNASGDVEFNQLTGQSAPDQTTTAGCRTAGDKLVAYDYLNGGTGIDFHVLTWIDSDHPDLGENSGTCYVKNDNMPCWGANVLHPTTSSDFDGQSNYTGTISQANNGISYEGLAINQFAEFGTNLSKILDLGSTCQSFPQQVWETRTSGSSFSSNPEDIEFSSLEVSNCGSITIIKHTSPRGENQVFNYTSDLPEDANAGGVNASPCTAAGVDSSGNFCLNDSGNVSSDNTANTLNVQNLLAGTYHITEGSDPTGYAFDSVSCKNNGTTADYGTGKALTIPLAPGDNVVCTYVNNALGEIKIIKHTDPRGIDQVFKYTSGSATTNDLGTDSTAGGVNASPCSAAGVSSGVFCLNDGGNTGSDNAANTLDVKNLPLGDYTVNEALPDNWTLGSGDLTCNASGTGSSGSQDGTTYTQANITLAAGGVVTCTYVNKAPGEIKIIKRTDPRGIDQVFSYTSNLGTDSTAGGVNASPCTAAGVDSSGNFCLNDSGNVSSDNTANTLDVKDLAVGSYNVTETLPTGWTLESLSCGTGGSKDGTTPTKANITLAAGATVTCTYQNKAPSGAIVITKESSKTAATALSGAEFQVCTNDGPYDASSNPCTAPDGVTNPVGPSGSDGKVCVDGLFWNGSGNTYYVQETKGPDGYSIDTTDPQSKLVNANASCPDTGTPATITFKDTPLTDLTVEAKSQATGGTQSTISCKGPDPDTTSVGTGGSKAEDSKLSATDLEPGIYTCTVNIDP